MKKLYELKAGQLFIFVGKKGIFSMVESNEKNVTFLQCVIAGDGKPYAMQKAICRHNRTKIYSSYVLEICVPKMDFEAKVETNFNKLTEANFVEQVAILDKNFAIISKGLDSVNYTAFCGEISIVNRCIGFMTYYTMQK